MELFEPNVYSLDFLHISLPEPRNIGFGRDVKLKP